MCVFCGVEVSPLVDYIISDFLKKKHAQSCASSIGAVKSHIELYYTRALGQEADLFCAVFVTLSQNSLRGS